MSPKAAAGSRGPKAMSKSVMPSTVGDLVQRTVEIGTAEHDAIERDETGMCLRSLDEGIFKPEQRGCLSIERDRPGSFGEARVGTRLRRFAHPRVPATMRSKR